MGWFVVSGGAGFVGSFVVDQLVDAGHGVRVIDALVPSAHDGLPDYLNPSAEYVWARLEELSERPELVAGADGISHQAGRVGLGAGVGEAARYATDNDVGTASLLDALAATGFAGRLVLASSMVVYGEGGYACPRHGPVRPGPRAAAELAAGRFEPGCPHCGDALTAQPVTEEAPIDPRNTYAATKAAQEHLCRVYGWQTGVPVTALRYHNVYGPRMPRDTPYAGVASIFRSAYAAGSVPRVFEDGCQRRDFVHARDVAAANVAALTADEPAPGVFNVASGQPHTVAEMASALGAAFGAQAAAPRVTGEHRLGDVRHVFAAADKARHELGFVARVDFAAGMRELATASLRQPADAPDL
jgi:dTDP-L-rhamnose 4-epimerase